MTRRYDWDSYRQDRPKHLADMRAANRARYLAVKDLISEFPADFDRIYTKHARREGVTPVTDRARTEREARRIERELTRLRAQLAQLDDGRKRQ